jgi:hypothetical protein
MKRSHVFGTILAVILVVSVAVAAIAPAFAHQKPRSPPVLDTEYVFGSGADVILQLPSGVPSHHTDLKFAVQHGNKQSTKGAEDVMSVFIWVPTRNAYTRLAIITDNPLTAESTKKMYAGMVTAQNIILVADNELEVWKKGDVLTANLTKAIPIIIGDPAPQWAKDLNFTLPPIALEFRGFDQTFREEESGAFAPSPPYSGWTFSTASVNKPAWVRVWIRPWLGTTVYTTVGTLNVQLTQTFTPPPEA